MAVDIADLNGQSYGTFGMLFSRGVPLANPQSRNIVHPSWLQSLRFTSVMWVVAVGHGNMSGSNSRPPVGPIFLVPGRRGNTVVGGLSRCTRKCADTLFKASGYYEDLFSSFE